MPKPIVLCILDGFGHSDIKQHNAIAQAKTPCYDALLKHCPHTFINASGHYVGLPDGQMGNSEVGHMTIGAGRPVYQDLTRIHHAIHHGDFFKNPCLKHALTDIADKNKTLHVMGLLSPGGVHSHEEHLFALLKLAKESGVQHCCVHAFLDGRDTPPKSAADSIERLEKTLSDLKFGHIQTVSGRYYAMDRDQRWDRIEKAYRAIAESQAEHHADTAIEALSAAYARNETDEFVQPTIIGKNAMIEAGDGVVFFNFRADRSRQLSEAFINKNFKPFERTWIPLSHFVGFTNYDDRLNLEVAFPKEHLQGIFAEIVSEAGLKQLRVAETEKYAHVTFFFNGGQEQAFKNEDRQLINSPKVATYDLEPAMSAEAITDTLIKAIEDQSYDVIICNYANADMVGHTGNFDATVKAIEILDHCLKKLCDALDKVHGEIIITADHGNADAMYDTGKHAAITSHTSNLVPFIYRGRHATMSHEVGALADIAPSLLSLLGLKQPNAMSGKNLIKLEHE